MARRIPLNCIKSNTEGIKVLRVVRDHIAYPVNLPEHNLAGWDRGRFFALRLRDDIEAELGLPELDYQRAENVLWDAILKLTPGDQGREVEIGVGLNPEGEAVAFRVDSDGNVYNIIRLGSDDVVEYPRKEMSISMMLGGEEVPAKLVYDAGRTPRNYIVVLEGDDFLLRQEFLIKGYSYPGLLPNHKYRTESFSGFRSGRDAIVESRWSAGYWKGGAGKVTSYWRMSAAFNS